MTASACRFCGTALRRSFVDLGRSPLSNAFLTADQLRRDGAALSAARLCLRELPAGAARGVRVPRHHLHGLRVFLVVLRDLAASRGSLCGADDARAWAWRGFAGRGTGQQRRLSAAVFPPAWHRCSRRGAGRQCRRGGRSERRADRGRLLRCGDSASARRRGQAGRPDLRQQRAGARARPERLRRRTADPAEALRHDHGGIPAPAAPDRGTAVRHDLSRALLVFLAARGGQGVRATRPARVRRRSPADAWRLAAHPCLPRGAPRRPRTERFAAVMAEEARSRA